MNKRKTLFGRKILEVRSECPEKSAIVKARDAVQVWD
jgi:hypothetical protein